MKSEAPLSVSNLQPGMTIAMFIGHQTLGDFLGCHICAASIVREVPNTKLVVIYREDRPYKNLINKLNPHLTTVIRLPKDPNVVAPIDWFDEASKIPQMPIDDEFKKQGLDRPDLFLTPSAAFIRNCILPHPKFKTPSALNDMASKTLKKMGLDENRWFATVHVRESNYFYRKTPTLTELDDNKGMKHAATVRNFDPETYIPMLAHIIREQGGQLVRVGDPSMRPVPKMDGLIDLSKDPDSFPEQVFAISRSRYFIGTPSGPVMLACAFKVPAAMTNAFSVGVWNPGDVLLMKKIFMPDGTIPDSKEVARYIGELPGWHVGVTWEDNTTEQLIEVADHLYDNTKDCTAWRDNWPEAPYQPSGKVTLPLPRHDRTSFPGLVWMGG